MTVVGATVLLGQLDAELAGLPPQGGDVDAEVARRRPPVAGVAVEGALDEVALQHVRYETG